jgi:hypothetical protein
MNAWISAGGGELIEIVLMTSDLGHGLWQTRGR